mgnify:CR=1 FL=1
MIHDDDIMCEVSDDDDDDEDNIGIFVCSTIS